MDYGICIHGRSTALSEYGCAEAEKLDCGPNSAGSPVLCSRENYPDSVRQTRVVSLNNGYNIMKIESYLNFLHVSYTDFKILFRLCVDY